MRETGTEARSVLAHSFTLRPFFGWLLAALALALLGAHFFRAGNMALVSGLAVIFGMHCMRSAWTAHAISFILTLGSIEWMFSAWKLAAMRMHFSMPWIRGAAILIAVSIVTLAAAACASKQGKRRESGEPAVSRAIVFVAAFSVIHVLSAGRPGTLLLERFLPMAGGMQTALLAAYAAYLYEKLLDRTVSVKTRQRAWGVFSVLFFGQIALGISGIYGPFDLARLHIPVPGLVVYAPVFRGASGMMPFLVLAATLLAGGAWCSMLCYLGPLDALAGKGPIKKLPPWVRAVLRYGRWVTLILGLGAAWTLRLAGVSPYTAGTVGAGFGIAGLIFMAVFSRRYHGMVHCAAYCPMGLVVNLLSRLSPWRIRVNNKTCNGCGVCERVCAYRAVTEESRKRGGTLLCCTLCRDCVAACPHGSLYVHNPLLPLKTAERVFVGTVSVLHVLFIAAIRPY